MQRINLETDIRSMSDFRANITSMIDEIKKSKRPMVLTQHGKSAVVVLDVSEFECMLDKLELLNDVEVAEDQIKQGLGVGHDQARSQIINRVKK